MTVSIGMSTGAALNPAKIVGPGLIGKAYWAQVPYLIGIFGGTLLSGLLCEFILFKKIDSPGEIQDAKSEGYERELPSYAGDVSMNSDITDVRDDRELENSSDSDGSLDLGAVNVSQVISQFSDDDYDQVM